MPETASSHLVDMPPVRGASLGRGSPPGGAVGRQDAARSGLVPSPGFWAVEPDLSEVGGMETCLCVPQSTIPSFCLCGTKTQVPESMLKSPNKPSGKPCISGKAHNKQTALVAWERMGSVTLPSNLSAAAPCV